MSFSLITESYRIILVFFKIFFYGCFGHNLSKLFMLDLVLFSMTPLVLHILASVSSFFSNFI